MDFNEYEYLCHHGIQGMKWGIRRYQNPDGSLTKEGKERLKSLKDKDYRKVEKTVSKLNKYYDNKINKAKSKGKNKRALKYEERKAGANLYAAMLNKEIKKAGLYDYKKLKLKRTNFDDIKPMIDSFSWNPKTTSENVVRAFNKVKEDNIKKGKTALKDMSIMTMAAAEVMKKMKNSNNAAIMVQMQNQFQMQVQQQMQQELINQITNQMHNDMINQINMMNMPGMM